MNYDEYQMKLLKPGRPLPRKFPAADIKVKNISIFELNEVNFCLSHTI